MARVFDLDLEGVRVVSRDFAGANYGPDQRQFKVVIEDPNLIENFKRDGINIWCPEPQNPDDPRVGYLTVKVSYRFMPGPKILLLTPEGNAQKFSENNVHELDKAWIKDVELHIHGSSWERSNGQKGVSVYLDTFVGHLISKEERENIMGEAQYRNDPIREKYRNLFGD